MRISYVGHAKRWDAVEVRDSIDARDCWVAFRPGGQVLAVATIGRDGQSLRAELEIESQQLEALASVAE